MNVQTIVTIVMCSLSVVYMLGLGVFALVKRHQNKKQFDKEVQKKLGSNDEKKD